MKFFPSPVLAGVAAAIFAAHLSLTGVASASTSTIEIADPSEALTLARVSVNGSPQLMSVSSYVDGDVSGVVLTGAPDDPITAFQALGFEGLDTLISESGTQLETSASDLLIPVSLTDRHIAAGTNFPEHAEEATVEDGPFLFTKAVQPTKAGELPYSENWLLDFEVELCFVGFDVIDLNNPPEHVGLFLCNDFTDRAALLRHLDPFDPASGKGFTTGKSAPGFMPIGDLFVIPRDRKSFVPDIELTLSVDGKERQRAFQRQAVWNFEEMLGQIDQRRDMVWDYRGTPIMLPLDNGTIPLRTALLGGTPSGTIFQGDIGLSVYLRAAFSWLFGGWDRSIVQWVIETVIEDAKASGDFLKPGNQVVLHADKLGTVETLIVAP
ncbi:MAG: fumarylacetoacetate hydrolase family protein [Parvibaculaceae bacterium]|nr:fumarylacetoacetate hydrolase family protein [Parvibaculaceae bacterium]|tara:strand:+ start:991 stop:2133 length:1143 start_codon:yes stop_codon:yes gene_type:complete